MLYESHLISNASGKLSGLVASRNRGGQYFRAHVTPTDPATAEQLACRSAWSAINDLWESLTSTERNAWNSLASNYTVPNRLGITRAITPRAWFFRMNAIPAQLLEVFGSVTTMMETPPPFAASALFASDPTIVFGVSMEAIQTSASLTYPVTSSGTYDLACYIGEIIPPTVNRYFGPYTLVGFVHGSSPVNSADFNIANLAPYGNGQRRCVRIIGQSQTLGRTAAFEQIITLTS